MDKKHDEELILTDELPEGDDPDMCAAGNCWDNGLVLIGEGAELSYCPEHAAETLLQLAALPMVQQALAERGKAVLILDQVDHEDIEHLQMLLHHSMVRTEGPGQMRQALLGWCSQQLAAINKTRTE